MHRFYQFIGNQYPSPFVSLQNKKILKCALGNSFSPMMIHDASPRYQNSISNPEESFVDDFDDLDVTFNQHVYTPKALNSDNEGHFPNKEKLFKVNEILILLFPVQKIRIKDFTYLAN